jgi:hypothetical protein
MRRAQPSGTVEDGTEHWLNVGRRTADDTQDLTGRRLLLLRLRFVPQRLRQARLQVAHPSGVVLGRLAGNRGLGFHLGLRGLWTPAH